MGKTHAGSSDVCFSAVAVKTRFCLSLQKFIAGSRLNDCEFQHHTPSWRTGWDGYCCISVWYIMLFSSPSAGTCCERGCQRSCGSGACSGAAVILHHQFHPHTLCPHTLCQHTLCHPHTLCPHTLCQHTPFVNTHFVNIHPLSTHTLSTYTLSTHLHLFVVLSGRVANSKGKWPTVRRLCSWFDVYVLAFCRKASCLPVEQGSPMQEPERRLL